MKRGLLAVVAAIVLAGPVAGRAAEKAKGPGVQTAAPQAGTTAGAAQAPAAPATKPEAKPPGVTITPYGFILVNAWFNASNFTTQDYPGFATGPGAPGTSAGSFLMGARQTRMGLRFTFPDAVGAKLAGVIEADFKAGYANQQGAAAAPPSNLEWYRPVPRLRLAYGTATWGTGDYKLQLLAGQEYGLVNPLFATTLAWVADPIFYFAGNIWRRAPMVRLQGDMGGPFGITWAVAAVSPTEQGFGGSVNVPDLGVGNRARMPSWEGRLSANLKSGKTKVLEVGVAGQISKERWTRGAAGTPTATLATVTQDVDSRLVGVDVQVNAALVSFKGEAFTGSNIDEYFAHFTGTPASGDRLVGGRIQPIRAQGAWGQVIVSPVAMLQLTFGGSIERDKKFEIAQLGAGNVYMNRQLSGGLLLSPSKNWRAGVEVAKTLTTRTGGTTAATAATAAGVERQGYVTAVSTQFIF